MLEHQKFKLVLGAPITQNFLDALDMHYHMSVVNIERTWHESIKGYTNAAMVVETRDPPPSAESLAAKASCKCCCADTVTSNSGSIAPAKVPLCIDCKHFVPCSKSGRFDHCAAPAYGTDPVYGQPTLPACSLERERNSDRSCGPQGSFFEAKVSESTDVVLKGGA